MDNQKFIKVGEKTKFSGIEIQCKKCTNDDIRPCTICLLFKKCTESHLLRGMCFGNLREDKQSVYFGKPTKHEYDIHS